MDYIITCTIFINKEMAIQIAPSLVLTYQASLNQGVLPDDWLKAKIVPVYK